MNCGIAEHIGQCSFAVAGSSPVMQMVGRDQYGPADTVSFGTSDPTINPAEMWMTAYAAAQNGSRWQFFNYPLGPRWLHADVTVTFAPYGFSHPTRPFEAVTELGLPAELTRKLTACTFHETLAGDPVLAITIEDAVRLIRAHRRVQSFSVVNLLQPDGSQTQVHCSHASRRRAGLYREHYRTKTIGELLARGEEKLGGSILYFLAGYTAATQNAILLLPHTLYGDVWGAAAAGAVRAGKDIRVLPIGHLDLLTAVQWRRRRETRQWYKAPPRVVSQLEKSSFRTEVVHAIFNERRPVAVSYDEGRGSFSFVES